MIADDSCDGDSDNTSHISDDQEDREHAKNKQQGEAGTLLDIQRQIEAALKSIGLSRIGTVSIGKTPLRRSKALVLCETEEGEWRCEARRIRRREKPFLK